MRNIKNLLILATLGSAVGANAVLVPIAPFGTPKTEHFNLAAGAYAGFPGFAGFGGFSRVPAANALVVTGAPILPPLSAPNAMFGRGTNVMIRFQAPQTRFGGHFRVPNAGIAVNQAKFIFRNAGGAIVGIAVAPVNNLAWQWRGWGSTIPFQSVEIDGNGPIPGYVGMDYLRVN